MAACPPGLLNGGNVRQRAGDGAECEQQQRQHVEALGAEAVGGMRRQGRQGRIGIDEQRHTHAPTLQPLDGAPDDAAPLVQHPQSAGALAALFPVSRPVELATAPGRLPRSIACGSSAACSRAAAPRAVRDQPRVTQLLRDGCAHFRKAFDIEDINVDDLIATAMDDPQAFREPIPSAGAQGFWNWS